MCEGGQRTLDARDGRSDFLDRRGLAMLGYASPELLINRLGRPDAS